MGRINEGKSTARVLGEVYTFLGVLKASLRRVSNILFLPPSCVGLNLTKKKGSQLGGKKTKQELDNCRGFSAGLEGDSKTLFTSTAVTAFGM